MIDEIKKEDVDGKRISEVCMVFFNQLNALTRAVNELYASQVSSDDMLSQHDQELEALEDAVFEKPDKELQS